MARVKQGGAPAMKPAQVAAADRMRGTERRLLLLQLPLIFLASGGLAASQPAPREVLPHVLLALGGVWAACFALHLLLCLTRFDGDVLLLPLVSTLFTIGTAYHLDPGPSTRGSASDPYYRAVLVAIALLALVTAGGPWFRRLSILVEEKLWWRVAGDRPYYASFPFHLALVGLMLLLALLLLLHGIRAENGALIQVRLPGGVQFTPSELIRLAVAFFLADYLGRNSRIMRNLRQPLGRVWPLNRLYLERRTELSVVLITVGLYCFFFYAFHDFGPAAVVIFLTLLALYAASGRLLTPLLLGLGIALLIAVPTWKDIGFHTLRNRFEMWFNPWETHFAGGDHQARILWSMAAGGWTGLGPGTQNLTHTLPLARNDAAFAGIAATMGMWTGLAVLALYAAITWRGMVAARQAPTDRGRLLAFCLTALLGFQALWICGAMVRVFPFTGINVPFISTGLTSMIASALALGTIWNLSRPVRGPLDPTESTPDVLRGVSRLALPMTAGFALPAVALVLQACPWLMGDRILTQTAYGRDRAGVRTPFANPYLERFKRQFPRGRVFSADGTLLAVSNPDAQELDAIRKVSPSLATYAASRPRTDSEGERYYPLGANACQLIGWASGGRFAAKEGSIETSFDSLLRGYAPQKLPFYYRCRNNPLVPRPQQQDLQLTIQTDLQKFAAERLARAVRQWKGRGGALVVYDATTGAVLAAATAPSFDPKGLDLDRMKEYVAEDPTNGILTNKALARDALYFPGSSFKILTAAAGLQAGIHGTAVCRNGHNANPVTWEYAGKHYTRVPGRISDYSNRENHGTLDLLGGMDTAMAESCNVFFGQVAAAAGPERLRQTMLDAELHRVPTAEELAEHLPYSGFGQIDVKTSPLEMAMVAGAAGMAREDLPNSTAARPFWVQSVLTPKKRRQAEGVYGCPDTKVYRPFPAAVGARLRQMMVGVVENPAGTAHAAFYRGGQKLLPGITVGGKTGTAEFEKQAKAGSHRKSGIGRHAWFVGFARSDFEVQPRTLAFAVLVEDVRPGSTGGRVCAPVAADLIRQILPAPGREPAEKPNLVDQFYRSQVRPRLGPLGPILDWIRDRLGGHQ